MKTFTSSPYLYGVYMLLGFLAYFFAMKAAGLYSNPSLRIFNILIHGTAIYFAMKAVRKHRETRLKWLSMILIGLKASVIGVVGFALFQFVYLQFINPEFLSYIQQNAILGEFLTPVRASFFLLAEGLAVSIFFSYLATRFIEYREAKRAGDGNLNMKVQENWRR